MSEQNADVAFNFTSACLCGASMEFRDGQRVDKNCGHVLGVEIEDDSDG